MLNYLLRAEVILYVVLISGVSSDLSGTSLHRIRYCSSDWRRDIADPHQWTPDRSMAGLLIPKAEAVRMYERSEVF